MIPPCDSTAQRLLVCRLIPRSSDQQFEPALQTWEQSLGREEFDTSCRQFDRQGQAVQLVANGGDGGSVFLGQSKVGLHRPGSLCEEANALVLGQALERRQVLHVWQREGWHHELVL